MRTQDNAKSTNHIKPQVRNNVYSVNEDNYDLYDNTWIKSGIGTNFLVIKGDKEDA